MKSLTWSIFLLTLCPFTWAAPGCYVAPALPCTSSIDCSVGMTVAVTGVMNCGASWCDASHCAHTPTCVTGGALLAETGNCQLPGTCSVFWFLPPGNTCTGACDGDCVNCAANCGWTACTGATAWVNGACGAGGCGPIQREQTRTGLPAGCTGGGPFSQCVPDATCGPTVPVITSFIATPPTILLSDSVALSWTAISATPITYTLDQSIGAVAGPSYTALPVALGVITYTLTATNAAGSATSVVSVTVNPSPPRCGAGHVCGNVSAYERPAQALHTIPVELYDSGGRFLRYVTTDINGHYDFPMAAGSYIARAMPDRTWNPVPNQANVTTNNIVAKGNFMMMRVPAVVTILAPAGTFVAFTRTPILTPSIPDGSDYFSAVTDLDNKRKVNVYGGYDYYMTCWKLNTTVWPYVEVKGPSQHINGGSILWPQDQITETCP